MFKGPIDEATAELRNANRDLVSLLVGIGDLLAGAPAGRWESTKDRLVREGKL